jgi:hypothetical protein
MMDLSLNIRRDARTFFFEPWRVFRRLVGLFFEEKTGAAVCLTIIIVFTGVFALVSTAGTRGTVSEHLIGAAIASWLFPFSVWARMVYDDGQPFLVALGRAFAFAIVPIGIAFAAGQVYELLVLSVNSPKSIGAEFLFIDKVGFNKLIPHEGRPIVRIITGLLCLAILLVGLHWKAVTFRRDAASSDTRMKWIFVIWFAAMLGAVVWSCFHLFDAKFNADEAEGLLFGLTIVGVFFILKSWIGPIIISTALAWTLYDLSEHDRLSILPIFELTIERALPLAPDGASIIYAVFTLLAAGLTIRLPSLSEVPT